VVESSRLFLSFASRPQMSVDGRYALLVAGGFLAVRCDRHVQGGVIESAMTRSRPKSASRVAPKRPDGEPSLFASTNALVAKASHLPWRMP
jgi:hypothetical protein